MWRVVGAVEALEVAAGLLLAGVSSLQGTLVSFVALQSPLLLVRVAVVVPVVAHWRSEALLASWT